MILAIQFFIRALKIFFVSYCKALTIFKIKKTIRTTITPTLITKNLTLDVRNIIPIADFKRVSNQTINTRNRHSILDLYQNGISVTVSTEYFAKTPTTVQCLPDIPLQTIV
ncbi:hypothetical protein H045_13600 [Pseudomonas poae RE*1-1-14]|nr:hypothetical protein H045_13600 [Pseudomonas poae RE*1-1-14]